MTPINLRPPSVGWFS